MEVSMDSTGCRSAAICQPVSHLLSAALLQACYCQLATVRHGAESLLGGLLSHVGLPSDNCVAASNVAGQRLWRSQRRARRALVGFARAVSDAAFVATVHDVAVMPELQDLGLGRQLLQRLTGQVSSGAVGCLAWKLV